jgi:flagellar hook-basal body complex protein FliE
MTAILPIGASASLGSAATNLIGGAANPAAPAAGLAGAPGAAATADGGSLGSSFINSLGDALGRLNGQLTGADAAMSDFAAGGSADIHSVMLEMQEASIGLKVGIAVRDKLLEAYQEVMRLSI